MATATKDTSLVVQDSGRLQTQGAVDEYRVGVFLEMGFGQDWAEFLSAASESKIIKDRKGREYRSFTPLYHGTVRRMLDQGYTHDQVCKLV